MSAPASQPGGAERRRHERLDLFAQVRVHFGRVDYVLELANISASGALVLLGSLRKPDWMRLEQEIEVAVIHPETADLIVLPAVVVRLQQDARGRGFAVEFRALDGAAADGLGALLGLARKKPPPLPGSPERPAP